MSDFPSFVVFLWAAGGAVWLVGVILLGVARHLDARNYVIEKAPLLPLRLVNARDDVWVQGTIECAAPLLAPYFALPCAHYHYTLEEKVTRTTVRQGRTETRTTWETREHRKETTRFRLVEGERGIGVAAEAASFSDLVAEHRTEGRLRHTLRYLPASGRRALWASYLRTAPGSRSTPTYRCS